MGLDHDIALYVGLIEENSVPKDVMVTHHFPVYKIAILGNCTPTSSGIITLLWFHRDPPL